MRKRKKVRSHNKIIILVGIAALTFTFGAYFAVYKPAEKFNVPTLFSQKAVTETFYPTQYSDTHITKNAIVTDRHLENLFAFERESLTASVAESIQTGAWTGTGPEKGTWLWTPVPDITPAYASKIISGAKSAGLSNIYLSIDSYLDIFAMPNSPEKDIQKKAFDKTVEDFVTLAHKNNMTVDAEGGWRNWAEPGNEYKAFAVIDYAIEFNKTHTEKLRGFQFDVEPYLLLSYLINKTQTLSNFLNLINASVTKLNRTDLQFSVVIPEFYDGTKGKTPAFTYAGVSGYTLDHLLQILERRQGSNIIVMSYRNFSKGDDGSIDISKNEISEADNYHTKVIVAQETGDVQPAYITFHNTSLSYYKKQVQAIEQTFGKEKSYGGSAVHYINSLMELE